MKKIQSIKLKKAFTLVELLVVMVIVGILIGLAVFGLSAAQKSARDTNRKNDLRNLVTAFETYAVKNNGSYPQNSEVSVSGTNLVITGVDNVPLKGPTPTLVKSSSNTEADCSQSANSDITDPSRTTRIKLNFTSSGFSACVVLEGEAKGLSDSR